MRHGKKTGTFLERKGCGRGGMLAGVAGMGESGNYPEVGERQGRKAGSFPNG